MADQHRALLDILTALPCMAMICGYWSQLSADRLTGWHTAQYQAMTRGGKQATEFLRCNFPPPIARRDYRLLGTTWRERERIKKKKHRWTARLHNMRPHERHALLAAIGGNLADPLAGNGEVGRGDAPEPGTRQSRYPEITPRLSF